jgi:hypothetical protein
MVQVRNKAENDTAMVSQSRSPITSVTGRRHIIETPKSPRTTRPIHSAYCTITGRSRPYSCRIATACSAETVLPLEARLAM